MRRRALLATAATSLPAVIAGCTSPGGLGGSNAAAEAPTARLELTTIADAKLPTKVLYTVRPAEGNDETAQLFDRILDGGATTKATRSPLPEQQHIAYQDGVYELAYGGGRGNAGYQILRESGYRHRIGDRGRGYPVR